MKRCTIVLIKEEIMKPKKIAQELYKNNCLLIWRREDEYWISDVKVLYILNNSEYAEFEQKYNSYKRTEDIPDINIGEMWVIGSGNDIDETDGWVKKEWPAEQLIKEKDQQVKLTDLYYQKEVRLLLSEGFISGVEDRYLKCIDGEFKLYQDEMFGKINVKIDSRIKAVIAPYRITTERYDKMWGDLKEISDTYFSKDSN